MYKAEILLDSVNPAGSRLTTMRVTFPRFILAEMNTHRVFSRNAASSRAISIKKRIEHVQRHGFIPDVFGSNQRGMQAGEPVDREQAEWARFAWVRAMNTAISAAQDLDRWGVHKQLANRLLEPFCWVTVIVSSTEWKNFFHLRDSDLAQPEMQLTAQSMRKAIDASTPTPLSWGEWHVPLAKDPWVAAGRLARVSYESDGKTDQEDEALARRLAASGHWSPFEHIAQALRSEHNRNFHRTWTQWRALIDS